MKTSFSRRPGWAAYFVLGAIVAIVTACEKPEDGLGLGLIPEEELLGLVTITDTSTVQAYTILADSARSSELSRAMVGDHFDPTFGVTQSTLYAQVRLSALGVDFADGGDDGMVGLDSLVLSLAYFESDSLYGLAEPMLFSVKRLSEEINVDSIYFSDDVSETLPEELMFDSATPITPNPGDSTSVGGSDERAQLRLRLLNSLGEELISESQTSDSPFDGLTEFLEYFKGLEISAVKQGGTGSILTFDLLSNASKLTLYYHNEDEDSLSFDFDINENSQRYMRFVHDYSSSPVQTVLDDNSTQDQTLYIHAAAGLNVELNLPIITSIADTLPVAFNKVELVFPVDEGADYDAYEFPSRLFAVYENAAGNIVSIPDIFEGELHADGFLNDDKSAYRVNITRFAQQVATGNIAEPKLRILPVNNAIGPKFVPLNGVTDMMGGARLIMTYTQYE